MTSKSCPVDSKRVDRSSRQLVLSTALLRWIRKLAMSQTAAKGDSDHFNLIRDSSFVRSCVDHASIGRLILLLIPRFMDGMSFIQFESSKPVAIRAPVLALPSQVRNGLVCLRIYPVTLCSDQAGCVACLQAHSCRLLSLRGISRVASHVSSSVSGFGLALLSQVHTAQVCQFFFVSSIQFRSSAFLAWHCCASHLRLSFVCLGYRLTLAVGVFFESLRVLKFVAGPLPLGL